MRRMRGERGGGVGALPMMVLLGLFLLGLAALGWLLRGEALAQDLWEWSWLLFTAGIFALIARGVGWNLWALGLISAISAVVWWTMVMGRPFP